ncbi:MAG: riboflavin synthase [Sedimentisphaerales bacterium]|nr:riboflavin synthase [Sedimentisphaerales bacterium]
MFTGLIETIGTVKAARPTTAGMQITIDLGPLAQDAKLGDSIAVNGACLTIAQLDATVATFDAMAETIRATTVQHITANQKVNLERALRLGDRLGGHLVQGHVDGIGTIEKIDQKPQQYTIWLNTAAAVMKQMIPKGSVAIDGVSLTIVDVQPERFSVYLIPTTLAETTLQHKKPGDKVNLETDIIAKWINQRIDNILGQKTSSITLEKLRQLGFA